MWVKVALYIPLLLAVLWSGVDGIETNLCRSSAINLQCNADTYKWVKVETVTGKACGIIGACSAEKAANIKKVLDKNCVNTSSCDFSRSEVMVSGGAPIKCAALITHNCIQGARTTQRTVQTSPPREDDWHTDYASWQWAIIWIVIAVVLVALIILLIMLINRCCYKALNQEKPKFVESTPTHSNLGSTLNSRSVSMSTLHRPPPKKEVSQEEIDEVRAQFGTARKNKDKNMKHFGVGLGNSTLDSRRSSGDGASGEPNSKLCPGDDSSSGIGSVTYDGRLKHALYDDTDTCHDDYVSYTMKKQAKSPLVNPQAYGTLQNSKRVDEDLYRKEAPTVDISEDRREENFRLDINSWTLNKHRQQQAARCEPNGGNTITVDVEPASSDIQLNPGGTEVWVLHDHQRIRTVKARTPRRDLLRQHSMLSAGSENLGFIPEYSTLPNKHSTQTAVHSDYITLPNKRSARNHSAHRELPNDNPEASIGSAADLHLNLSDLDASVSSDQFSLRKSSMTRKFYETFGTPRSVSQTSFADSYRSDVVGGSGATDWHVDDVHTLSYSYPNISLADEFSAASLSARAKEAKGTRGRFTSPNKQKEKQRTGGFQPDPAHLFSQTRPLPMRYGPEPDLWNSNRPIDKPRDTRFSNSRVKYLTQIKFGETVRLKEEAKKKRKREKRKGTIRYAFRSDVKGEKY